MTLSRSEQVCYAVEICEAPQAFGEIHEVDLAIRASGSATPLEEQAYRGGIDFSHARKIHGRARAGEKIGAFREYGRRVTDSDRALHAATLTFTGDHFDYFFALSPSA